MSRRGRGNRPTGRVLDGKGTSKRLAQWAKQLGAPPMSSSSGEEMRPDDFQYLCRTPEHSAVWEFLMSHVHRADTAQLAKDNLKVQASATHTEEEESAASQLLEYKETLRRVQLKREAVAKHRKKMSTIQGDLESAHSELTSARCDLTATRAGAVAMDTWCSQSEARRGEYSECVSGLTSRLSALDSTDQQEVGAGENILLFLDGRGKDSVSVEHQIPHTVSEATHCLQKILHRSQPTSDPEQSTDGKSACHHQRSLLFTHLQSLRKNPSQSVEALTDSAVHGAESVRCVQNVRDPTSSGARVGEDREIETVGGWRSGGGGGVWVAVQERLLERQSQHLLSFCSSEETELAGDRMSEEMSEKREKLEKIWHVAHSMSTPLTRSLLDKELELAGEEAALRAYTSACETVEKETAERLEQTRVLESQIQRILDMDGQLRQNRLSIRTMRQKCEGARERVTELVNRSSEAIRERVCPNGSPIQAALTPLTLQNKELISEIREKDPSSLVVAPGYRSSIYQLLPIYDSSMPDLFENTFTQLGFSSYQSSDVLLQSAIQLCLLSGFTEPTFSVPGLIDQRSHGDSPLTPAAMVTSDLRVSEYTKRIEGLHRMAAEKELRWVSLALPLLGERQGAVSAALGVGAAKLSKDREAWWTLPAGETVPWKERVGKGYTEWKARLRVKAS